MPLLPLLYTRFDEGVYAEYNPYIPALLALLNAPDILPLLKVADRELALGLSLYLD